MLISSRERKNREKGGSCWPAVERLEREIGDRLARPVPAGVLAERRLRQPLKPLGLEQGAENRSSVKVLRRGRRDLEHVAEAGLRQYGLHDVQYDRH